MKQGFYIVTLGVRQFWVCVARDIPLYVQTASDSGPIPWDKIMDFQGEWAEASLIDLSKHYVS
jgi:hypothetical protein